MIHDQMDGSKPDASAELMVPKEIILKFVQSSQSGTWDVRWANRPKGMTRKATCQIKSIRKQRGNAFMEKIKPNHSAKLSRMYCKREEEDSGQV